MCFDWSTHDSVLEKKQKTTTNLKKNNFLVVVEEGLGGLILVLLHEMKFKQCE